MGASYYGRVDVVKELLGAPGVDVNLQDDEGCSALHLSCHHSASTTALCKLLLQSGADIHLLNNKGNNAHQEIAASCENVDLASPLLHDLVGTRGKMNTDVALGIIGRNEQEEDSWAEPAKSTNRKKGESEGMLGLHRCRVTAAVDESG